MKKIYRNLKTAVLALGCMSLLLSSCSDFWIKTRMISSLPKSSTKMKVTV